MLYGLIILGLLVHNSSALHFGVEEGKFGKVYNNAQYSGYFYSPKITTLLCYTMRCLVKLFNQMQSFLALGNFCIRIFTAVYVVVRDPLIQKIPCAVATCR
jgi:hypothetical protein